MACRRLLLYALMFACLLSLWFLASCFDGAGDDDATDDDSHADNDSADDDTGDDDTDDDSDDDEPDTWGGVWASEGYSSSNYMSLSYFCSVGAGFYDPDDADWNGEPDDEEGDCRLYYYDGDNDIAEGLSAGRITVTGANISPIYLDPVPYQYGYYYQANVDFTQIGDLFDAGDAIRAHIAGGSGIEESDLQVSAPPMISVTKPSNFDSLSSLPVGSVTFGWNAGGAEKVFLTISTFTGTFGVVIQCEVEDSQGEITVASRLMSKLQQNPQMLSVTIMKSNDTISGGARPVSLSVTTYRQRSYIRY